MGNREKIVLSGVNCVSSGILSIFQEALLSVVREYRGKYQIIAIVHRRELFDVEDVTYIELPRVKSSWLRRLWFEYKTSLKISKQLRPKLWLSMHDMTPNVDADVRAVYCHNPAPFYLFHLRDAAFDPKFGLFTLFYRYLYEINIRKNSFVIVQQDWIRKEFRRMYDIRNVIVAQPTVNAFSVVAKEEGQLQSSSYRMFYPAFPRTFKNFEVILEAARMLENNGFIDFELWLTLDGSENRYAARIRKRYAQLRSVRWLGLLSRRKVFELYEEADCLIFPSKLETWGLPITEFKITGKPILAADLSYAHETVGTYNLCAFFDPDDPARLAEIIMRRASMDEAVFAPSFGQAPAKPYARNWDELWPLLLGDQHDENDTATLMLHSSNEFKQ
jgi:glycosyltransferase involved in cell wall biosynthesis